MGYYKFIPAEFFLPIKNFFSYAFGFDVVGWWWRMGEAGSEEGENDAYPEGTLGTFRQWVAEKSVKLIFFWEFYRCWFSPKE